jgi:hypothetical protein
MATPWERMYPSNYALQRQYMLFCPFRTFVEMYSLPKALPLGWGINGFQPLPLAVGSEQ